MSGIYQRVLTARAVLSCDARDCPARWESEPYDATGRYQTERAGANPAFSNGWRVFVGARSQHTYCPDHGPKTPMRLLYGPGVLA